MDGQNLVCRRPVSFHSDLQRAHKKNNCSRKSLRSYESDVRKHRENSDSHPNKGNTALVFPGSIEENFPTSNDGLSTLIADNSDAYRSAGTHTDTSAAKGLTKKGARRKFKTKVKQNKKFSSVFGMLPEKGEQRYSEDENCGTKHISDTNMDGNATTLVVIAENFDVGDSNKNCSSRASYIHESKEKRMAESMLQNFSADNLNRNELVDGRSSELRSTSIMSQTVLSNSDEGLPPAKYNSSDSYNIISGNLIRDAVSDKGDSDGSRSFRSDFENFSSNIEDNSFSLDGSLESCHLSCNTYLNNPVAVKGFHCYGTASDSKKYNSRVLSSWRCKLEGEFDKQVCSTTNSQSSLSSKKGSSHIRKLTGTSSWAHRQDAVVYGRNGNNNPSAVWQRVQKDDKDEFANEPKRTYPTNSREINLLSNMSMGLKGDESDNASLPGTFDEFTHRNDVAQLVSDHGDSSAPLPRSQDNASKNRVTGKYVGKISLHSKQNKNFNYRMKHHGRKIKSKSTAVMETVQRKELVTVDNQLFPSAENVRYGPPLEILPLHLEESRSPEIIASDSDVPHSLEPDFSGATVSYGQIPRSRSVLPDSCSDDSLFVTGGELVESTKLETEGQHPDCENQVLEFGLSQKWVPVGRKTMVTFCTGKNCSSVPCPERSLAARSLEDVDGRELGLLNKKERAPDCRDFDPVNGSFTVAEEEVIKLSLDSSKSGSNHKVAGKKEAKLTSLTAAEKIVQAVNDSYRLRLQSEIVHLATGHPVAEFESFLHDATPILCLAYRRLSCYACSANKAIGDSLCRHQIPNLSLGNLWQWYERSGSCGLEIKVEDFQPKRLGPDRFAFRAYFVPFLSAVQLFGHSKSCTADTEDYKSCFKDKYSENTASNFLPMLAMLLPQPLKDEDVEMHLPLDGFPGSDPLNAFSVDPQLGGPELLFEYFETDQPQLRQPLFEKIQELVRNEDTSNGQMFGDPLKLEHLNLHDIHPLSWYSVAWYPIYRIPDGNFRAAFLTYHSLGHFIYRSASSGLLNMDPSIVSPVIGLQSYNAQSECWFQLRNSGNMHNAKCSNLSPSEILRDRLRTLEQTACLLATTSVCRENQKYENRQPDYGFFLSRRR